MLIETQKVPINLICMFFGLWKEVTVLRVATAEQTSDLLALTTLPLCDPRCITISVTFEYAIPFPLLLPA